VPKTTNGIYSQRFGDDISQSPATRNHKQLYRSFSETWRKQLFLTNIKRGDQVLDNPTGSDLSMFWNIV
jgi:hypothetical protein